MRLIVEGKQVASVPYHTVEARKAIVASWKALIKGKFEVRIIPNTEDDGINPADSANSRCQVRG